MTQTRKGSQFILSKQNDYERIYLCCLGLKSVISHKYPTIFLKKVKVNKLSSPVFKLFNFDNIFQLGANFLMSLYSL